MEKKIITTQIEFDFDWTCNVSIEQLKKDIEKLEQLGATHVDIDSGDSIEIEAYNERYETDEEFKMRIEKKTKRKRSR